MSFVTRAEVFSHSILSMIVPQPWAVGGELLQRSAASSRACHLRRQFARLNPIMRAMVLDRQAPVEESPLQLRNVPEPIPGRGEVRVRVHACGICRTDLHTVEGDVPLRR
jgi:hypothetical protein